MIEIKEGFSSGGFLINCVSVDDDMVNRTKILQHKYVKEVSETVSVSEETADNYLLYFFEKYIDDSLIYNRLRYSYDINHYLEGFQWYIYDNFYTYKTMNTMLEEMEKTAYLIKNDYHSELLNEIKTKLPRLCFSEQESENSPNDIADFYSSFVFRIKRLMADYPRTNLISVLGL